VGKLCEEKRQKRYIDKANSYIKNLQKYENASKTVQIVKEGEE